jgi:hypothetical protein
MKTTRMRRISEMIMGIAVAAFIALSILFVVLPSILRRR